MKWCIPFLAASSSDLRQAAGWERTLYWWMERWVIQCVWKFSVCWISPTYCQCMSKVAQFLDCYVFSHHQVLRSTSYWREIVFACVAICSLLLANLTCLPQNSSTKRWWTLRRERRMALWRDSLHLQVLSVHNPNRSVSEFTTTLLQFLVNRRPPSCCWPCVSVSVAPPAPPA